MRHSGACEDNAVQVINDLLPNSASPHALYGAVIRVQATDECGSDTVETILRFLTDEEEKEMLHVVQDRGLLDVLAAIGSDDDRPALLLDNISNERFRADLQFLRAEGLIGFCTTT